MNINHACWRFPALLSGHTDGTWQPTRGGSNADIRSGLAKLLGLEDTPTKEACTPTGCAVPVASEETGMDSLINTCAHQGSAGQRKAPMADASTTTMPAGQGQPAGSTDRCGRTEGAGTGSPRKVANRPSHSKGGAA